VAAAAALVFVVSGCGGDDDEQPASADTEAEAPAPAEEDDGAAEGDADAGNACELVSAEEAEEAMGKAVEVDDQGSNGTFSTCSYNSEAGDNFILTVAFGAGPQAYESAVEVLPDAQALDGVGDGAVYIETGTGAAAKNGAVYAIAGEDYFTVAYSGDEDPEAVTTEVAGLVADRL